MNICKICNINEANQTGAHIFPAWMIASAFDEDARTRDNEVIHTFYPLESKLPYFGREVDPDKIEENIGRELTEEEATGQKSELIVSYIWCRICEKKLKIVEDYFLERVDRSLCDFTDCEKTEIRILDEVNIYLIRLFIYSLIYRSVITELMGFQLDKKTSDKLNYFLTTYIKLDLKATIDFIKNSGKKNELLEYPIKCLKTEYEKGKTTNFVFIHKKYDKPFCFIINRYIIQFYTKEKHIRFTPYAFWGITDIISKMDSFINYRESKFQIGMISLELWNDIKSKFVKHHSYHRMENYILIYKKMFKTEFGRNPDKSQITRFLNELTRNNHKLGVKYTVENIVEAMNKSLRR